MSTRGFHALDAQYWNDLLNTLQHPSFEPPENDPNKPQENYTPPPEQTRRYPAPTPPSTPPPRESDIPQSPYHQTSYPPPPSPPSTPPNRSLPPRRTQPSPSPRRNQGNYVNGMGSQLTYSLRVLALEPGVTRREVNVRYIFLARRRHPDKYDPEITGMTSEEAVELFKRVNNVQQFIRDSM